MIKLFIISITLIMLSFILLSVSVVLGLYLFDDVCPTWIRIYFSTLILVTTLIGGACFIKEKE
jgi:hypothetical protein